MKVLVAIDESGFAADVLRAVTTQFRPGDTEVRLIHVVEPVTYGVPQMAAGYTPELDARKEEARKMVNTSAGELTKAGFNAQAEVEVGDIREKIIDAAEDWKADLIVLGSHGHRHVLRFLLGSVAEFVSRHAHCSVQIVRGPSRG